MPTDLFHPWVMTTSVQAPERFYRYQISKNVSPMIDREGRDRDEQQDLEQFLFILQMHENTRARVPP